MPLRQVPGTNLKYYLVCHDEYGNERLEDNSTYLSAKLLESLAGTKDSVSDVFLISHGWKGDIPAAIEQYDKWTATMAASSDMKEKVRKVRPDFSPLIVGLHWPSLPWGDEELGSAGSFTAAGSVGVNGLIDRYAGRIANTPSARTALKVIFTFALKDIAPDVLPTEVIEAYKVLESEAHLHGDGTAGLPGHDRDFFDPQVTYQQARVLTRDVASFGGIGMGGALLSPLRQLSFWKMKDRARTFGENGAHSLLRMILENLPSSRKIRCHTMGHSFGCIVVSAMIAGPPGSASLPQPIDSVMLIQGALSLWSYCSQVPSVKDTSGYFYPIIRDGKVRGPIVTTQSNFDTAVGRFYPLGAWAGGQIAFDPSGLPKYGALGAFGAQGPGFSAVRQKMLPITEEYAFEAGKIYNLNGDAYIRHGGGASGAHSDICHPEVVHAMWSAVLRFEPTVELSEFAGRT